MARKKYIAPPIKQSKTVKHPEYRTLDVYQGGVSKEQLSEIRRVLAKQANQRIVRLEREKSPITGESYNEFGAVTDVYDYLEHKGRHRFSESKNAIPDVNQLKMEIVVLQGFLGRKTSTVSGMREIEQKRLSTFESGKWGSYFDTGVPNKAITFGSTKEFYNFLNSATFKNLVASGFTSEQIIESYDISREKKTDEQTVEEFEKALEVFRSGEKKLTLKNLEEELDIKLLR